ncbi:hypothetical protein [Methyloprofundus sp.]|uniref:hypothetical protein n=1 Tax=Methyloprofundus sp. TaxID=2020875 RepID=UPI003D0D45E1
MNKIVRSIAILVLSAASLSAFAKDKPMNMQHEKPQGKGMEMSEQMLDKMAKKKQQYILKIDELSDRIQDEKDAKKKQALMDEQLQLIKGHMKKKRDMKKKMMNKHHQKMMNKKDDMKM